MLTWYTMHYIFHLNFLFTKLVSLSLVALLLHQRFSNIQTMAQMKTTFWLSQLLSLLVWSLLFTHSGRAWLHTRWVYLIRIYEDIMWWHHLIGRWVHSYFVYHETQLFYLLCHFGFTFNLLSWFQFQAHQCQVELIMHIEALIVT